MAALLQLGWKGCGDGITRGHICQDPSLLEPGAVGTVPLSHTGLHSSGTALQRVLVLLLCLHRGEGCLKELFKHNI